MNDDYTKEKNHDTEKADLEGKIHNNLLQRFLLLENEMRLVKEEMELIKNGFGQVIRIATGQRGEELDEHKYKMLISEYKKFKTKHVKHYRFNSAADLRTFGKP